MIKVLSFSKSTLLVLSAIWALVNSPVSGQNLSKEAIQDLSRRELSRSMEDFRDLLLIPNDGHYAEQIAENLDWCRQKLESLGFATQVLEQEGVPHLFAHREHDPAKKTILVYLQIDGVAPGSTGWEQENPYHAVLKEEKGGKWIEIPWDTLESEFNPDWRVFARSTSDSKGPAMAFFTALDILNTEKISPGMNLKVILDFQEEMSSPKMAALVAANKELFSTDGIIIMDGTRHLSNLPNLAFGARGIATATIKIFGAKEDLHSGQYGNFAPNPVFSMSRLLAAMKDEDGRVLIPGFYEGVGFSETDLKAMAEVPETMEEILGDLGLAKAEKVGDTYQQSMQYPSLNVRGLSAGGVGSEVKTVIPSVAVAEIDIRLVRETPGERQLALLRQFIIDQGFHLIAGTEPINEERKQYSKLAYFSSKTGSLPFRADMDGPFADWLDSGMRHIFGSQYVKTRQTGGSQPMAPFINILGAPAVSVRIPNPDNSIHAPNENIRIQNYLEGIQACLSIFTRPF
jgi:acetylornithine deacetylase/succinyl-diaminopimelate desuccinylase-like protein